MINLHKIKTILTCTLVLVLIAVLCNSCKKDIAKDPEFGAGDYPRIFYAQGSFPQALIINTGDTAKYGGISYSPAGKVSIKWVVNDEVMSTDTSFVFVPATGGEFNLKLEVEYNGLVSTRTSQIVVKPATYERKDFSKVMMGYLSYDGAPTAINWNVITHLAAQIGRVSADGSLDITRGNANQLMDQLVAKGHIRGIPVLLALFGRITPVDGWALYESDDMGAAIRDPSSRALLVEQAKNYIAQTLADGVDIMMTDFNGSPNYSANLAALGPFISELKAALPANSIVTVTVTTGWQHWEYPDLSAVDWVNVHAFEDGVHVGPGAPVGQASSLQYMKDAATIWLNHMPANKIVLGLPVFGLRYNELDADGNNASWGSYDYVPYNTILTLDAAAASKEFVSSAEGIYYNGLPLIKEKAEYIKGSDFKGAYAWYVDADAADSTKSLVKEAFSILNP